MARRRERIEVRRVTDGGPKPRRVFLTAAWRHLAMLNYRVDPSLLDAYVPAGTALDLWRGSAFVSVVGFLFDETKVLGVPIPLHRTFPEANLRLYVRRDVGGEARRGVTFIRELVPRQAVAWTARLAYNEPYRALRMRRRIAMAAEPGGSVSASYEWMDGPAWAGVHVAARGLPSAIEPDSEEEFISYRLWGYTRQRDGSTVEYAVEHPRWRVWPATSARLEGDLARVYPPELARELTRPPDSAFLAEGSAISVSMPERI
jgi:hypothetical protein